MGSPPPKPSGMMFDDVTEVNPALPTIRKSDRPPIELGVIGKYGRYDLLGRIAYGGMAEIFLARARDGNDVTYYTVIKRILPHVADDEHFVQMFLDEARLAMRLSHPGICSIFEFGSEAGTFFIAMEYVHGVPLGKLMRRAKESGGGLPVHIATKILALVADALHYAHTAKDEKGREMKIVHRDVSPHNVMVSYDGRVKLLDFGVAKAATHAQETQAGVVKGKFAYMSPQQCQGEDIDHRADVFALGICAYELLTGEALYHRSTEYETMRAVIHDPVPSIRELRPEVSASLDVVARKALAKAAEDRFQSAAGMRDALEATLSERGQAVSAATIAEYVDSLFHDEIRRGPLIDSVPLAAAYRGERDRTGKAELDSVPVELQSSDDAPIAVSLSSEVTLSEGEVDTLRPPGLAPEIAPVPPAPLPPAPVPAAVVPPPPVALPPPPVATPPPAFEAPPPAFATPPPAFAAPPPAFAAPPPASAAPPPAFAAPPAPAPATPPPAVTVPRPMPRGVRSMPSDHGALSGRPPLHLPPIVDDEAATFPYSDFQQSARGAKPPSRPSRPVRRGRPARTAAIIVLLVALVIAAFGVTRIVLDAMQGRRPQPPQDDVIDPSPELDEPPPAPTDHP